MVGFFFFNSISITQQYKQGYNDIFHLTLTVKLSITDEIANFQSKKAERKRRFHKTRR